jgi:uncharacterized membrane protein (UPF0127 family)
MARYIRIDNLTRGSTVAERCRVASSILQRIFGLHLVQRLKAGEGLLLPDATTIDTTFMGYAIDLVFLDRSLRVTRTVPSLRPWRMVLRTGGGRDCLELPAGAAAASGTQAGDQLAFTEADISAG